MSMKPVVDRLAKRKNYGSARNTSKIKYIVIHYTGNDGDSAKGNANYFASNIPKASAHYFVDDNYIYRSVPDNFTAYSVGGRKYNNNGGRLYGQVNNTNSLSVELCDTVRNGVVYPTNQTILNAIELVNYLMALYNVPLYRVIRHYDVNGKPCPAYWTNDAKWESEFHSKLSGQTRPISAPDVNPYKEPTLTVTSSKIAKEKGLKVYSSRGEGVKWVQWELSQYSEYCKQMILNAGGIDGVFGETTAQLVTCFQQIYGLTADGIVGISTRTALKKY